jgi:pyruvate/2-oxoglutarate dehydrogenase complex dihydrolipoamide acyltransferase (E2) component
MEMGSIAKWLLKEGDKFEAGTAICEVETDKATVTYEATEEGYIAKVLVGTGEVKVRINYIFIIMRIKNFFYLVGWSTLNDYC